MKGVAVGCCGFPVSRARYFREFSVVEVQQTFYEPPMVSTARRWRQEAPAGFEFTMKAWQLITHEASSPTYRRLRKKPSAAVLHNCGSFKPTDAVMDAWRRTDEIRRALEARVVVFQCPASFAPTARNKDNLRAFFRAIERENLVCVWEPRGSWQVAEIRALCQELDLVHCVDPFKASQAFGDIAYWRLHGIGGYSYRYSDENLRALAEMLAGRRGYCMFNNAAMYDDATRLLAALAARSRAT